MYLQQIGRVAHTFAFLANVWGEINLGRDRRVEPLDLSDVERDLAIAYSYLDMCTTGSLQEHGVLIDFQHVFDIDSAVQHFQHDQP